MKGLKRCKKWLDLTELELLSLLKLCFSAISREVISFRLEKRSHG